MSTNFPIYVGMILDERMWACVLHLTRRNGQAYGIVLEIVFLLNRVTAL